MYMYIYKNCSFPVPYEIVPFLFTLIFERKYYEIDYL